MLPERRTVCAKILRRQRAWRFVRSESEVGLCPPLPLAERPAERGTHVWWALYPFSCHCSELSGVSLLSVEGKISILEKRI